MRLYLAIALALELALPACDRHVAQDPSTSVRGMSTTTIEGESTGMAFLSQIADAPFRTAYYARRHVWQASQEANSPETIEYTERVWSDGQGHFSVTPEQLLQPSLSANAQKIFLLTQKAREGFIYRLRDFRIRELDTFLLAYRVQGLQQVSVAGQACERLRIRAAIQGHAYWEIDVDPSNGLILSTHEFLEDGTLVSSVETLEFQANPDLSSFAPHQDLPAEPFTPNTAEQVLGFAPLHPNFLPRGFALVKSEKISQDNENWARCSYSDGGETLFLLYRREPLGNASNLDPGGTYTIKIFSAGLWTVAQASFGEHQIIVMGREPASILQQVVESCVP
jgi:hypothetical protein